MKTKTTLRLFLILMFIQLSMNVVAQGVKDFFNNDDAKTTWLGVDFTEVRVMGVIDATPSEMKEK